MDRVGLPSTHQLWFSHLLEQKTTDRCALIKALAQTKRVKGCGMCFTVCKKLDNLVCDPLSCSLWCSIKAKDRWLWGCQWKQWFLKHVAGPGNILLLGCFTTCGTNQVNQRNMYYKKIHIFPICIKTSPSDNSRHSKRYSAFDLSYTKRLPKQLVKPTHSQKCHVARH